MRGKSLLSIAHREMIDALPDVTDINNDNIEEVRLQFKAVEDAMIQLSVEESVILNIARYLKVAAVLYGPFPDIQNPILGTDIKWTISRDNKTITISGKGKCLILIEIVPVKGVPGRTKV